MSNTNEDITKEEFILQATGLVYKINGILDNSNCHPTVGIYALFIIAIASFQATRDSEVIEEDKKLWEEIDKQNIESLGFLLCELSKLGISINSIQVDDHE